MILKNKFKNIDKIKLIIFDIDYCITRYNTMEDLVIKTFNFFNLEYKKEYYQNTLNAFSYSVDLAKKDQFLTLENLVLGFEIYLPIIKSSNINTKEFALKMLEFEGNSIVLNEGMDKVLKDLNTRYKVVCLTNWFFKPAKEKLENTGVLKYISKIYTCEDNYAKPRIESFLRVLKEEGYKEENCVMLGDSYSDIISSDYGIQSILTDYLDDKYVNVRNKATAVITEAIDIISII
jgi:FMN phosphatase YigB (HAD superfamily)